ncbi:stealth family protein [Streptomycetaceae bacterium NBC_01309]
MTGVGTAVPRAASKVRQHTFKLRHARHISAPDRILLANGAAVRVAEVVPALSPLAAQRRNLERVREALDIARIPYFCVRGKAPNTSVVAVRESRRNDVLKAVRPACGQPPGYVAVLGSNAKTFAAAVPGFEAGVWNAAGRAGAVRVFWLQASDPAGRLVLGEDFGCEIEFWREEDGMLVAPRPNRVADELPSDTGVADIVVGEEFLTNPWAPHGAAGRPRPIPAAFDIPLPDDITFPVDAVYTWVDGGDAAWQARRDKAMADAGGPALLSEQAANDARYLNRDELRYSLRSIDMYAPWIRTIYLVTDRQTPAWLDTDHPRVEVVDHRDIFTDPDALPTFNSHAIESQLHHIDGLAEHFLYFNDDVFLGRPVTPATFFHANGLAKHFTSPSQVKLGPSGRDDAPVVAAGKNNRALISAAFARVPVQKFKHAPHALLRSVLTEIEERFGAEHAATAGHRFRDPADISVTSSLHHNYAFLSGRSVPSDISFAYADLAARHTPRRLNRFLEERALDAFCLNDTESELVSMNEQVSLLRWFLDAYFPVPADWER